MNFIWSVLYDKVRAWLVGGTAAGAISGAVLWGISQALSSPIPPWVTGLVTAGAAQLVGFAAAYLKTETKGGVAAGEDPPPSTGTDIGQTSEAAPSA